MTDNNSSIADFKNHSGHSLLKNSEKHRSFPAINQQRQRGLVLIIGLILLAMLIVIAAIGFRNTTLSERMTGNAFDRNTSFQSAENAGKEALVAIEAGFLGGAGYYAAPLSKGGNTAYWSKDAGAEADCSLLHLNALNNPPASFSWTSCAKNVSNKYTFSTNANSANNAQRAQYTIELMPPLETGKAVYRVTSRSTGGSGVAEVILQATYIKTGS